MINQLGRSKEVELCQIAGVIAGAFTSLLMIVVTLVSAGTFHAASQQIAVDKLTVKTAFASLPYWPPDNTMQNTSSSLDFMPLPLI